MKIFNPTNPKTQKNNSGIEFLGFPTALIFVVLEESEGSPIKTENSEGAEKGSDRINNGNRITTPNP
jgi:hypothetical protein